ncbi:MAG: NAD-dependent epimerase/dehydratase family protein, partial [Longimicrobiales bacterium]
QLRTQPRTWLVTGVAGFIGSNLLEKLLDLGQTVVGLDDFSSGYRRNIDEVLVRDRRGRKRFRLIEGDIRDAATCKAACKGVDYVLHEAAIGSVPRSVLDPAAVNQVNVDGTLRVLTAAREAGTKRVVFASSSAVFGDSASMPLAEEMLGGMLSPYAVSKYTDEKYGEVFSRIYGLETVGLRYFNVFGPRQDPLGSYAAVIPQWIHALLSGEVCHIHGDGETTRDFVAIADVVQANLLSAVSPLPASAKHRVYNVGAGRRKSLKDLQSMLATSLQQLRPAHAINAPVHDAVREGDIRHSQADIGRITAELGYSPAPDLAQALQATMCWYLKRLTNSETLARTA